MSAPKAKPPPPRHTLRTTVKGDVKTELDQVIAGLPWANTFTFGAGVDALTGAVTGSAVEPFTPVQSTVKSSTHSYRFIQSENELDREIEVAASGKYNIEGITLSASTSYLNKLKFSELSTTLVAHYQDEYHGYDEAPSYELTDKAKELIVDPAKFRNAYGDYFVSGSRRGSLFTAVYTCQSTTAESMDEFKASFSGSAPEVFTAEGSARFMQKAREHNIKITSDVFLDGYTGNPPPEIETPELILKSLAWFMQNEVGKDLEAKLRHYSTIDPNYPHTVDVAPDVFVELRLLYTALWDVRAGYGSLPSYYQDRYKSEYTALDSGVMANKGILITDAEKRIKYQQQADVLLSEIRDVYARMDFYYKVKAAVKTEPGLNHGAWEGSGQQKWMYGFSAYTKSKAVVIQETAIPYYEDWHIGYRQHTFDLGPDDNYMFVGWEMVSDWDIGVNGQWWQATDQILLTNHAAVAIKSYYDKGFGWTAHFYYVDAKDYQF
jgi:hypothetical protein